MARTFTKIDDTFWGIIRCAPSPGETDAAAFDGWYSRHADASAVAERWRREHPSWRITVVQWTDR